QEPQASHRRSQRPAGGAARLHAEGSPQVQDRDGRGSACRHVPAYAAEGGVGIPGDERQNGAAHRPRRSLFCRRTLYSRIFAADCSVIHTPHAKGIPTNSQNAAARQSRPPLPMPNEPDVMAPAAVAACSLATSSALMYHFGFTGLTRRLQIKPMTSM